MGLTNKELLAKIENILEAKFDEKFSQLSSEIEALKQTNTNLININKVLIAQNQALRANLTSDDTKVDIAVDTLNDAATAATTANTATDPGNDARVNKIHKDVVILSDSIYRHVGSECPKKKPLEVVYSEFQLGSLSILKVICPGARCDRLFAEASFLHQTHTFGHVIVNVG